MCACFQIIYLFSTLYYLSLLSFSHLTNPLLLLPWQSALFSPFIVAISSLTFSKTSLFLYPIVFFSSFLNFLASEITSGYNTNLKIQNQDWYIRGNMWHLSFGPGLRHCHSVLYFQVLLICLQISWFSLSLQLNKSPLCVCIAFALSIHPLSFH